MAIQPRVDDRPAGGAPAGAAEEIHQVAFARDTHLANVPTKASKGAEQFIALAGWAVLIKLGVQDEERRSDAIDIPDG